MNHAAEIIRKPIKLFFKTIAKAITLTILTTGLMSLSTASIAGGWSSCDSNFSLASHSYQSCSINSPTLETGNDTQTNLYLLLADKGLIGFDETETNGSNSIQDFPLSLEILQNKAVNKVKNPDQFFLKPSEQSRHAEYCNSFYTGKETLRNALELDPKLTSKERQLLMDFRQAIRSECKDSFDFETQADRSNTAFPLKWSKHAQPYADYIMATQLFYLGNKSDFDSAHNLYSALIDLNTDNNLGLNWLIDTSNYMLIRTGINRIYQSGMGDYRYQAENVDRRLFTSTQQAIDSYLSRFKNGQYIASARGLQRRLYWLSEQEDKLINEIEWQINHPNSPFFNLNSRLLPEEIERRVFFTDFDKTTDINKFSNPIMLTSFALYRLRPSDSYNSIEPLTLRELKQLQPKFKDRKDLYQYLIATYYYVQRDNPKQALNYLPTATPTGNMSYSKFSQYVLKAKALQAVGNINQANALWDRLHKLPKQPFQETLTELALTLRADQTNDYSELFGPSASIKSHTLKMRIIKYSADPNLLKQIANSHQVTDELGAEARFALLTKSLLHGQYADYLNYKRHYLPSNADQYLGYDSEDETLVSFPEFNLFNWQGKKVSNSINCSNLTKIITRLHQNPTDRLQQACLAEFLYDTNLTYYLEDYNQNQHNFNDSNLDSRYPYLGAIPNRFEGQKINRLDLYRSIFATNRQDELSAYALHRAIGCFASSGNNHCSDEDVDLSVRKAWFKRLKSDFGHTSWAKNQKYYW